MKRHFPKTDFLKMVLTKLPKRREEVIPQSTAISITFINPYSYWIAKKQNIEVYKTFDFICFDGILFPKLLYLCTGISTPRISFDMTSLAPMVFKFAAQNHKAIYFVGSTTENINKFFNVFQKRYPEVNVLGCRNGFFSQGEKKSFFEEINSLHPDIVIVGMGTPHQDIMISEMKKELPFCSFYSCGGFFHQSIEDVYYYPNWINKYHLRWLYRIYDEPKLFKRYFYYYPISIIHFIFSCFKYRGNAFQKGC